MAPQHDLTSRLKIPAWFIIGAVVAVHAIGLMSYVHETFDTVAHAKERLEQTRDEIARMHDEDVKRWDRMENKIDRIMEQRIPAGH